MGGGGEVGISDIGGRGRKGVNPIDGSPHRQLRALGLNCSHICNFLVAPALKSKRQRHHPHLQWIPNPSSLAAFGGGHSKCQ
jgi:hypothetical protein